MKELKYLRILYISNNFTQNIALDYLNTNAKVLHITYNSQDANNILTTKKVDIIFSEYNDMDFIRKIRNNDTNVQFIVFTNQIKKSHLIQSIQLKYIKYLELPIKRENLISALIDCIQTSDANKSNIINLKNGYTYDYYNQILLKDKEIVLLSKKENDFFKFMSKRANETILYKEINETIWKGSMTRDALRSVVKELRKKTYKELIKNISGIGYRFNLI